MQEKILSPDGVLIKPHSIGLEEEKVVSPVDFTLEIKGKKSLKKGEYEFKL